MRKLFISYLVVMLFVTGTLAFAETNALEGYYNLDDYVAKTGAVIKEFRESPSLQGKDLPPLKERLPKNPLVVVPWEEMGKYGGTLRWSSHTISPDYEMRHVNHVGLLEKPPSAASDRYNALYGATIQPGIFEDWSTDPTGTVFTFTLREGLKWSDGVPVTTEDVRFNLEDFLFNTELTPALNHDSWLNWQGIPTQVEYLDDFTFRVTLGEPFGALIDQVFAMGAWQNVVRPSHYLKQFHKDYTGWEELLPKMAELGFESQDEWARFFLTVEGNSNTENWNYKAYPTEYPSLNPWITVEVRDDGEWLLERNPYFYMIDPEGNQLPYIDALQRRYVSNPELVNMDILAGKTDIIFQIVGLDDYPLLVKNKDKGGYEVMPLKGWQHHMLIFFFNLGTENEDLRSIFQDLRFRQAMSHAIDRDQVQEAIFLGFGRPATVAPDPGNPFYEEGMEEAYTDYDPEKAKQLLDEMGMVDVTGDGWRNRPDGEDYVLQLDYFDVTPAADQGAEMAKRYWEAIGVRVNIRKWDVQYFWEKHMANQLEATLWWLDGDQTNFFTFHLMTGWRQWFIKSKENVVEPVDWAKEMFDAMTAIASTPNDQDRIEYGKKLYRLQAEYIPFIGTVVDTPLPVVYNKNLGNAAVAWERDYSTVTFGEGALQFFFK